MADIFISYKREELARAAQVAQALAEEGFSAFYDLHEDGIHAGEQWDKRLEAELEAAHCCVVLWSVASVASDNVRSEARRANQRGILVPAKISACTPPIGLDSLQEADLRAWRGDRSDPQWRYLVDRGVARKLGRPGRPLAATKPEAARPPPPPPMYAPVQTPQVRFPRSVFTAGAVVLAVVVVLVWQPWNRGTGAPDTTNADEMSAVVEPNTSLRDSQVFRDCADCPKMVVIPAGSFARGSRASEPDRSSDEGPQRRVTIARFALGQTEVTRGEWAAFVAATNRPDPQVTGGTFCTWRNPGFTQDDNHPVTCVDWEDARAYAAWLRQRTGQTYRLPSEAEWEYAARARTTTAFSTGTTIRPDQAQYAWDYANRTLRTAPVGSFPANAFGLYDTHGNVSEWVQDCYADSYAGAPTNGSALERSRCSDRVRRGGSWDDDPDALRSAYRSGYHHNIRDGDLGFRVARTV